MGLIILPLCTKGKLYVTGLHIKTVQIRTLIYFPLTDFTTGSYIFFFFLKNVLKKGGKKIMFPVTDP